MMENNESWARKKINDIVSGVNKEWSNLKKARYICIELCNMYHFNPKYNYGSEDEKDEIFNVAFGNAYNFKKNPSEEQFQLLNLDDQYKICVELQSIYSYLLSLVDVKHDDIGSDTIIYEDNEAENCKKYTLTIVKELYTVKTKRAPEGFHVSNMEEFSDEIFEIDRELGFIDADGYIGEKPEALTPEKNDWSSEKFLNNACKYISDVLKADIKYVEFHKYLYHLCSTLGYHNIRIIPFNSAETEKKAKLFQYLVCSSNENEEQYFLYNEEEKVFTKINEENIRKMESFQAFTNSKKTMNKIENIFDIEEKDDSNNADR